VLTWLRLNVIPCMLLPAAGPPDIAALSRLLADGANVNSHDPANNGSTPLHILAAQTPTAAFSPAVEDYQQAVIGPMPPQVRHNLGHKCHCQHVHPALPEYVAIVPLIHGCKNVAGDRCS
jgi:hypothetical protein